MEFKIGNSASLVLPPFHITIILIIIIFLLARWSRQLETGHFKVFLYFLISTFNIPLYSHYTEDGAFELFFPLGFIIIFFYLYRSERYHPAKMKASILGLCVALYQIISKLIGYIT